MMSLCVAVFIPCFTALLKSTHVSKISWQMPSLRQNLRQNIISHKVCIRRSRALETPLSPKWWMPFPVCGRSNERDLQVLSLSSVQATGGGAVGVERYTRRLMDTCTFLKIQYDRNFQRVDRFAADPSSPDDLRRQSSSFSASWRLLD